MSHIDPRQSWVDPPPPGVTASPPPVITWEQELGAAISDMNERHMLLSEQGKAIIYTPQPDPDHDNREVFHRSTLADFRAMYANRIIKVGEKVHGNSVREIYETVGEAWIKSPDRRQYLGGVVFDPSGKHRRDQLNLWRGFGVKPRQGSWARLKVLILDVMCSGNVEHYNYLIGWIAYMIQKPAERAEVSVVMRGDEGTGKGTLAKVLMTLIGQHAFRISNPQHLVGNFNAHLRDCIFLFADEAFYAGNPAHIGVLKALITEDMLTVEAKFQNTVNTRNRLHLMLASNNDWVVPASMGARRFFCLDVSSAHKDDHAYFAAIWSEMEDGGYEALMHDLLAHDLSGFNIRAVPQTEALQEQKKLSLPIPELWWMDCLQRGYVFKSQIGLEAYFEQWRDTVTTDLLFASYEAFAKARHERHPLSREAFGKWFAPMTAKATKLRRAVTGEHRAEVEAAFGPKLTAKPFEKARATGYVLGSLESARAAFVTVTGLTSITWMDTEADDDRQA